MTVNSYDFAFARKKELKRKILLIVCIFLLTMICLQLIFHFFLSPVLILSSSMKPGLVKNAALFILPLAPDRPDFFSTENLNRGDIVRVEAPEKNQLNFFEKVLEVSVAMLTFQRVHPFTVLPSGCPPTALFRLIGLPGDILYIDDYVVYIKKAGTSHFLTEFELSSADYNILIDNFPAMWDRAMGAPGKMPPITLGKDEYFVLCDNRISAFDSRLFGPVRASEISGKALFQYYPFTDIKKLY
ncbi:signal peptidase I [Treponema sp. OMZ 840]|uniref:signal peptidase I n=1 Tax=Treponema sp. OMZ 840 TaxID=244313 RepID=UPI003D8CE808